MIATDSSNDDDDDGGGVDDEQGCSRSKILVIGGTGMLGIPVVRQLASDGHLVRVLTRRQKKSHHHTTSTTSTAQQKQEKGEDEQQQQQQQNQDLRSLFGCDFNSNNNNIELVYGDVLFKESLEKAMVGCCGIHINLSGGELEQIGTENIVKAAISINNNNNKLLTTPTKIIKQITLISGISVCKENAMKFAKTKYKLAAEQALIQGATASTASDEVENKNDNTNFDYTIFRCTMFMETLPKWKYLIGNQPTKWHWIAAKDYSKIVSISYEENSKKTSTKNKILFVCGPNPSLTLKEAIDQYYIPICCCCDNNNTTTTTTSSNNIPTYPEWMMKLLIWLHIPGIVDDKLNNETITKFSWLAQISELGNPQETNTILDYTPSTTITEWCEDYYNKTKQR